MYNLKEELKKEKHTEAHIHSLLIDSNVGKLSSVELLLNYRLNHRVVAEALVDHDYCSNKLIGSNTINISLEKN